jgi:hypothetical protein
VPSAIKLENVRFWYSYYFPKLHLEFHGEAGQSQPGFTSPENWLIFVLFEEKTYYRQAIARFYGEGRTPQVQVRESRADCLIITLEGDIPPGHLDIYVEKAE